MRCLVLRERFNRVRFALMLEDFYFFMWLSIITMHTRDKIVFVDIVHEVHQESTFFSFSANCVLNWVCQV